jgi:mRNA deadenylase 3'-5' endonuclease subunit Ccr4
LNADVLCMQEVDRIKENYGKMLEKMGYYLVFGRRK